MSRAARLGAFIIVTLAVLLSGILIIGSNRFLFTPTYKLKTQFDNVAGLATGADVEVGGVVSGTVHEIDLPSSPGGRITVVMDMNKSTQNIIKQDSMASIETQGLLGNQYMAVAFGSSGKPDVRNGDMIGSYPPMQMADLIKKTNGILDSSKQAIDNTTNATANLQSITAKIDNGTGTAGALVNDKQLYTNVSMTSSAARDTMVKAQQGVADFQENMEALKHNFLLRGYFKSRGYEDSSELQANAISAMPAVTPMKTFAYSAKQLFDKSDSAEMKDQKTLDEAGAYLAKTPFGSAVIVASTGMTGDSQKDLQLTQARAMVVRDYLVDHFGFDDSQLKTMGMGKQSGATTDQEWGGVQIIIYPAGTTIPTNNPASTTTHPSAAPAVTTN
jgi:phospholipid/cholesterol/gamma-HCH transport system substrate-binding protein